MNDTAEPKLHFIEEEIEADLASGRCRKPIVTRFPPEPNAYLHIGHAKAICIVFGMAEKYGGRCHLRFDDTNPAREEQEYIDAIREDVRWLGFDWGAHEHHASDYFTQLYAWARLLTEHGHAYVDDQTAEEIKANRGTEKIAGSPSPFRDRSPEENLELLERMKNGEFPDGARVLRAKIDMASPIFALRDPTMYRILHRSHPHVGDAWCIYPMYDWAHGQSDWIEGITHSLCSLEFKNHRPLYEWFIDRLAELDAFPPGVDYTPRQIEFARGNVNYLVTSKRRLLELIERGIVAGWDDPRMPTLCGLRRRGFPPEAIRSFWTDVGVSRRANNIDFALVEHHVRGHLNQVAPRFMAVLRPLKVVITNYPEAQVEELEAVNNPEDPAAGKRPVPFTRELYIERDDFMEEPPKKFFRLAPGREVRLRYAYFITCQEAVKDADGNVVELHCTYDPATRGGDAPDGRKVKATLHWVSARHAVDSEVRLYDHLFTREDPLDVPDGESWLDHTNPSSLEVLTGCKLEPAAVDGASPGRRCQFERLGYFCVDPDTGPGRPVFNRIVTLRDTWARMQAKSG